MIGMVISTIHNLKICFWKANNYRCSICNCMNKNYETEARERWDNTDAYREHEQKTKNYSKEKWAEANDGLMAIFAEFASCKASGTTVDSAEAQALVAKLQAHITENYYTCTDEILAGLGKMYIADGRFKKNIDKSGEGTQAYYQACAGPRITLLAR